LQGREAISRVTTQLKPKRPLNKGTGINIRYPLPFNGEEPS